MNKPSSPHAKTALITPEGMQMLKDELEHIWRNKRPEITKKVSWAASLGDRSENADYQYNKKLLRGTDRRIRYLTKRIEALRAVPYSPEQEGKVYFGAWVTIESEQGEEQQFRVVGPDEIYDRSDYISVDSPMARALLSKAIDEEAIVQAPGGNVLWFVTSIRYEPYKS